MASASSSDAPKPTVGILSIGDMGGGIAKLLQAHDYTSTLDRIKAAGIVALPSDEAFVAEADIILSIVPPRDSIATARRVVEASRSPETIKQRAERKDLVQLFQHSIAYIDLNAVSPKTAKTVAGIISSEASPAAVRRRTTSFSFSSSPSSGKSLTIDFLDGGIIGGPPSQTGGAWKRPSVVISGPKLDTLLDSSLQKVLNVKNIGNSIGQASTLKACFASLTKGTCALAILSYTTAQTCDVLPDLREHLTEFAPNLKTIIEGALCGMPPKAYRWVDEMRQIGETFGEEGDLAEGKAVYDGVADIYRLIADYTVLGQEKTEKRKRGKTVEDVAGCVVEGLQKKRRKDDKEEKLDLTWRGSWS